MINFFSLFLFFFEKLFFPFPLVPHSKSLFQMKPNDMFISIFKIKFLYLRSLFCQEPCIAQLAFPPRQRKVTSFPNVTIKISLFPSPNTKLHGFWLKQELTSSSVVELKCFLEGDQLCLFQLVKVLVAE